jgi:hypothetical protein
MKNTNKKPTGTLLAILKSTPANDKKPAWLLGLNKLSRGLCAGR